MVGNRKALEKLYTGVCDVYEYREVYDDDTNITEHKEVLVESGIKCRLSYYSIYSGVQSKVANYSKQKIKLFLAPDVCIRAGSKVRVTQNGMCIDYKNSGEPAIYSSHQEVELVIFESWG